MNKPLILWGGTDIDPSIYKEESLYGYVQRPDKIRDAKEIHQTQLAIKHGKPIIGICRGAQLICALEGGKLIQHSIPSINDHDIETKDGHIIKTIPSAHHQIMVPDGDFELLAWDVGYSSIMNSNHVWSVIEKTPEALWYPKIKAFCVQAHPEWGGVNTPFVNWVDSKLKEYEIDFSFNEYNSSKSLYY
jgi:gamma-glutamyl-gamma-aminobutyrate hydrolase PuuD